MRPALLPKKIRTRALLVGAAVRLLGDDDGRELSFVDVAGEAGVVHGTVYNYFRSREELLEAVALELGGELVQEITNRNRGIDDPCLRISIGVRTFIRRAQDDGRWGRAILRIGDARFAAVLVSHTLADLRDGRRRGVLRYESERVALDLVQGTTIAAMQTVVAGRAAAGHGQAIARVILRGLGLDARRADHVARLPLPEVGSAPRGVARDHRGRGPASSAPLARGAGARARARVRGSHRRPSAHA